MLELLSFEMENHRSFNMRQKIDFGESAKHGITALYGANASGKSNVVRGLRAMLSCIANSSNANWTLPYDPFLLGVSSRTMPTWFSVTFRTEGRIFTYGFSFVRDRIIDEILTERSANSEKSKVIFSRNEKKGLNSAAAKNKFGKRLFEKTRPETLLITKAREDNNEYANFVFELLDSVLIIDGGSADASTNPLFVEMIQESEELKDKTVDLLRKCDISIRDIRVRKMRVTEELFEGMPFELPQQLKQLIIEKGATELRTVHAVRDNEGTVVGQEEFSFGAESLGTQKFFEIAVPLIVAIENGKTLVVDEFGSYVHPSLVRHIVDFFRQRGDAGKLAKLVLITHDTAMMKCLERDEILLVEKTLGEESRVIGLAKAGARTTDSFEKRYLAGYYGGIPLVQE